MLTVEGRLPDLQRKAVLAIERSTGLNEAKLKEWDQRLKADRGKS